MDFLEHKNKTKKEWDGGDNSFVKYKTEQKNKWNQSEVDCDTQRLNKILEWKTQGKELRSMMDERENKFFNTEY